MNEIIMKAVQTANLLVSDLKEAIHEACAIQRPEGRTLGDKAVIAYLSDLLVAARKLESDLLNLS